MSAGNGLLELREAVMRWVDLTIRLVGADKLYRQAVRALHSDGFHHKTLR